MPSVYYRRVPTPALKRFARWLATAEAFLRTVSDDMAAKGYGESVDGVEMAELVRLVSRVNDGLAAELSGRYGPRCAKVRRRVDGVPPTQMNADERG